MRIRKLVQPLLCLALLVMAAPSLAVTVSYTTSYIMDQSNALEDGVDYLSVTVSDETSGQLDFWVETLPALSGIAGENYGIQKFAFNFRDFLDVTADDFILPDGWRVQFNKGMSEFGKFEARIMGTGSSRQDPLHFSVIGLSMDDILPGFAAHVAGFDLDLGECQTDIPRDIPREGNGSDRCGHITSAYFYGDRETTVVPIPNAVMLFGSGLIGLVGIARRRT